MEMLRTRNVSSIPQIVQILTDEHGITASTETISRDLERIGGSKDAKTGYYNLHDGGLTRFDLYEMLRHAMRFMVIDLSLNKNMEALAIYTEFGCSKRVQSIIEGIRQDEAIESRRKAYSDNIFAVLGGSDDTVVVLFKQGSDGKKFFDKLQALKQTPDNVDLAWVENEDERNTILKVLETV